MNRIYQDRVSKVEIPTILSASTGERNKGEVSNHNPWQPPVLNCGWKIQFDPANLRSYLNGTSLLSVSTAGRGAVSSEAALTFFSGGHSTPAAKLMKTILYIDGFNLF